MLHRREIYLSLLSIGDLMVYMVEKQFTTSRLNDEEAVLLRTIKKYQGTHLDQSNKTEYGIVILEGSFRRTRPIWVQSSDEEKKRNENPV